jgi:membrane associated rhomboid family serine protease
LLKVSNGQAIVGLVFLALAMTGVVLVITDLLFHDTTVAIVSGGVALMFAAFWFLAPLTRRLASADEGDADEL